MPASAAIASNARNHRLRHLCSSGEPPAAQVTPSGVPDRHQKAPRKNFGNALSENSAMKNQSTSTKKPERYRSLFNFHVLRCAFSWPFSRTLPDRNKVAHHGETYCFSRAIKNSATKRHKKATKIERIDAFQIFIFVLSSRLFVAILPCLSHRDEFVVVE